MQKQQTTAGGETLSFDYTFDIPVEVAAAVCKYRHDRWKFEWGKPQFTRLDVAIGSMLSKNALPQLALLLGEAFWAYSWLAVAG